MWSVGWGWIGPQVTPFPSWGPRHGGWGFSNGLIGLPTGSPTLEFGCNFLPSANVFGGRAHVPDPPCRPLVFISVDRSSGHQTNRAHGARCSGGGILRQDRSRTGRSTAGRYRCIESQTRCRAGVRVSWLGKETGGEAMGGGGLHVGLDPNPRPAPPE